MQNLCIFYDNSNVKGYVVLNSIFRPIYLYKDMEMIWMTISLIFLTSVLLTCLAVVGIGAFFVRKKVTAMHGMMFAMSMAMGVGLFFGTLLGILFQGDLLLSTVIGIGAGVLAGAVFGSFYSFLALLDGVLAGVMAGMMGAMLGEMIKPEDWDKTVMIMFTIALSICFLIINEILTCGKKQLIIYRMYQNPFIIGAIFVLLCFFLYSLTPFISKPILPPALHH